MFFDPISVSGAEAPRLDMGMMFYSRRARDGQMVETYSAVFPSGGNTFVPSADDLKKKGEQYAAGEDGAEAGRGPNKEDDAMATDPELVQQLMEAIDQTDWAQWCKGMMAAGITPESLAGLAEAEATEPHEIPGLEEEEPGEPPTKFAAGEDDEPEKKEEKKVEDEKEPEKDK